jgi:uncharacterized tellurite resistance protein B-like protein
MPNLALIPALAKALLAIAWADGELHPEEEITVKEVIGLLPAISAREWAVIELYLLTPIGREERELLTQNLLLQVRGADDQRIAIEAVDAMLHADGGVEPAEAEVARSLHDAIEALDVSALGRLWRMIGGGVARVPDREHGLELWRTNPVFYVYTQRDGHESAAGGAIEVAALAAAIMAQVARVTPATMAEEQPVMSHALAADWGVAEAEADALAAAALSIIRRNVDYHRIARELARGAPDSQRLALLDTLFAIANAAENVAPPEIDEIRVIAERLNLARHQFIAAKQRIPPEARGGL